ncbi:hypothetical protein [Massilia suwonensis]|uniref:Chalcone isomerase domain-containing protein n=1 Tax=Massilia suwonensis TaxID=648895 RepID=A0ABW0MMN8_9BURK
MRLIAHRSKFVRHVAAAFILGMTYVGIQLPASAGECAAPVISKTTLAEAREMWAACDANIVSAGNLAIGGGSGKDGMSTVGLEQVVLVTVAGVDFEGLPVARYAFVDEVLYAISVQLRNSFSRDKPLFKELSDADLSQLEQSLTSKYGKPRALKDMGAGKKPNIFIWDLQDSEMTLTNTIIPGYRLSLVNKTLAKKVDAYRKTECKRHRQKGETPTPVTSVCL